MKEIIIDNFSILPKEILIEIICKLIEDKQLDTVEKAEIICKCWITGQARIPQM